MGNIKRVKQELAVKQQEKSNLKITMLPARPNDKSKVSDDIQTVRELIHNMDWNLLKAQKIVLTKLQSKRSLLPSEHETIEGILNLIDTIQDKAVDVYGYEDAKVFNHGKMTLKKAKEIATKG